MGRVGDLWYWLAGKDPALTPDDKLSRWVNLGAAGAIVWSFGGGAIGALFNYPWAGVGIGLALWVGIVYVIASIANRTVLRTESTGTVSRTAIDPTPGAPNTEGVKQLTAKLREAEQELDLLRTMSPEEVRIRQDERRKRIESWRTAIRDTKLSPHEFSKTDAYSDLRQWLQPGVKWKMDWVFYGGTDLRSQGPSGYKRKLLDEVARIEKEWGLL